MATVVRTTASAIVQAVIVQLQSDTVTWTTDTVFAWQGDEEPPFNPLGDAYAYVSIGVGGPSEPWVDGMGRIATLVRRRLSVTVRSRLALDEANRDFAWLTGQASDQSLAHLTREHAVLNKLAGFQPLDSAGDWLVVEPMRLAPAGIGKPKKSRVEREWGWTQLDFESAFLLDLDQSYQ